MDLSQGDRDQAKEPYMGGGQDIGIFSGKAQRGVCLFTSLTEFLLNKFLPIYGTKL